jgi:hypothetical protein
VQLKSSKFFCRRGLRTKNYLETSSMVTVQQTREEPLGSIKWIEENVPEVTQMVFRFCWVQNNLFPIFEIHRRIIVTASRSTPRWRERDWRFGKYTYMYLIQTISKLQLESRLGSGWPKEFVKNRPKCSPTYFLSKLMHTFNSGKSSPKIRAISVIFKNCPK